MRRRSTAILAGALAWLLFCSTALAATLDIDVGDQKVYANGNDVTVESSGDKTVITADDDSPVTYNRLDGPDSSVNSSQDVSGYTVYGGWRNGIHSGDTSVTVEGGTVNDVYGGNEDGRISGDTSVTVDGGTVTGSVYGSSEDGHQSGNTDVNVNSGTVNGDVYGGSEDGYLNGNTDVDVAGGTVKGSVYGGSEDNDDLDGNTDVAVSGGAVNGSVYGGSNDGDIDGDTKVAVSGGTVKGDVYGGGKGDNSHSSDVEGNTNVTVSGGRVKGSVYGGSDYGNIEDNDWFSDDGDTKVTISGGQVDGSVYAGSKSKGNVDDDATIEIKGGVVVSKKVYGTGGVEQTQVKGDVQINLYSFSASSYVFFLKKNLSGTSIIALLGDFAQYGGYTVLRDSSKDPTANIWAWVLQPGPTRTLTVNTNFVLSGVATPVNTISRTVSIPAGPPTSVGPSTWDGGGNYDVGTYPASLSIGYNYSGSTISFNVPVTPKADTVDVTFNYTFGGSTIYTETITSGAVTYGGGSVSVNSSWAGNTYFFGNSGSIAVSFGDEDKTVTIPLTPKTDTVSVTFNYLYNGTVIHTETVTSAVLSYGSQSDSLSSSWAGNEYFAAATGGPVTVGFGDDDTTVDVQLTAITDIVSVTFNYLYNGTVIHTETVTSAVLSYGSQSDSLSSSWDGNEYFAAATGGPVTVGFGDDDTTVDVQLTAITDTVSVTFNYTYGGAVIHTETLTSTVLSYGSQSDSLSSSWAGNEYFAAATGGPVTVNFGGADQTIEIALTPKTDTVSVTFNYLYNGTVIHTETVTSAVLSYGSQSDSLSSSWDGNEYFAAATGGPVTVGFGDDDTTVDVQLTAITDTVSVTFNYLYNGTVIHTETVTSAVLSYGSQSDSLSSSWDGNEYFAAATGGPVTVGFGDDDTTVDVQLTAITDTVSVTFNYLYNGTVIHTETVTSAVLSYGSQSDSLSSSWDGNEYFAAATGGPVTVGFGDDDTTVDVQLTAITDTVSVTFNYLYNGTVIHTETVTSAVLSYGSQSDSLSSSWDGNEYFAAATGGPVTVGFGDDDTTVDVQLTAITDTVSVTFNYLYNGTVIHTETVTSAVLSYGSQSDSLSSSWDGNEYFAAATGGPVTVGFGDDDTTVDVQLTAITDTVSVTFNYLYNGTVIHTEMVTSAVLSYGSQSDSLSSSWDGNENFYGNTGSATVNFGDQDKVVEISLTPRTKAVLVVFNYLYRGSVVHTEEIPVNVTYDGAPASVTPTWDGEGDYIVPTAEPASVGFEYQGETMTVNIDVRRVDNGNDEQTNLPLGPGTEGAESIPLGLPRTGGAEADLFSALLFAGATLAAALRRKMK